MLSQEQRGGLDKQGAMCHESAVCGVSMGEFKLCKGRRVTFVCVEELSPLFGHI